MMIMRNLRVKIRVLHKSLQPHQESVEAINLGTEEEKKKVKVRTTLEVSVRERLVKLLQEYVDVFAWSY